MIVHHAPLQTGATWNLHAWQLSWDGNAVWDPTGTPDGAEYDFAFPEVTDPRWLKFKYRATPSGSAVSIWEPDDFVRQLVQSQSTEIWTFPQSPRILYRTPAPAGSNFTAGTLLTLHAITRSRFAGGRIYSWNPYDPSNPSAFFPETTRDAVNGVSTFTVALAPWMATGFHFKLVGPDCGNQTVWEPNTSNRVWRPCDGATVWIKSGQCDVRSTPLILSPVELEVLVPASTVNAPVLELTDVAEQLTLAVPSTAIAPYPGSTLFSIVRYQPSIYPQAAYTLSTQSGTTESTPIVRPFPANPSDLSQVSRFVLGTGYWLQTFPVVSNSVTLNIQSRQPSVFTAGVAVQLSLGNAGPYQTLAAAAGAGGSWTVVLPVAQGITTAFRLLPTNGSEPQPYAWIDTARYFVPAPTPTTWYTTEGVFGVTEQGPTVFAEPASRRTLMQAAFGPDIASRGIFGPQELPHGATPCGNQVYFVVHGPHAVCADLMLIDDSTAGAAQRRSLPMQLTPDTLYWWCAVPAGQAAPGTRYHFVLNGTLEVLDPAARGVRDSGSFQVPLGADPNDATLSWSTVLDVTAVRTTAHAQPWQTMGWENLVVYEMHAQRFTDLSANGRLPLDLIADELLPTSRLGRPGYLFSLPVSALELLPVQEFSSALSWGYDPSFYFAIDGHYGGSEALARFVNTAHASGRAVLLDVVYNHSLSSPLMQIAPDVYRNGNYDGDRTNCGHPMVGELLRQATLHLFYTFGIDGIRFDDTQTIATQCEGGWAFLDMLRRSIRAAADALGRAWPYCVAENSATQPWDISNPAFGVMDGQWGIDEVYRIRDASYDLWHPGMDDASPLQREMNNPSYWGRPFYQAVRFGESHDMVSAQDPANLRIAARPPFGCGLQLAKALGTLTLLSNGVPMLFMGQEYGETTPFAFDSSAPAMNPQQHDGETLASTDPKTPVLRWFRNLLGLRNDPSQGLRGETNYQVIGTGNLTVAFTCGVSQSLFVVVTFGTPDKEQDSSWLGLPANAAYKEIFNSSWPQFQTSGEPMAGNGGLGASIHSGTLLNLPYIGAVVLQRS